MIENFQSLNEQIPFFFTAVFFVFGAIVGSFLNVCILRIPRNESIISPSSHCVCGKKIPLWLNIPIFSWIILRGKAACCGRKFSVRYALIEFLTAIIFAASWNFLPWQEAAGTMIFAAFGIVLAFIDWDTMLLPDCVNASFVVAGILISTLLPEIHSGTEIDVENRSRILFSLSNGAVPALVGLCVGGSISYWFRYFASVLMKREAMGEGDVILLGGIGAFFGWKGAVFSFFASAFIGIFALVITKIFQKKSTARERQENASRLSFEGDEAAEDFEKKLSQPFPLGPWLILGALVYKVAGTQIVEFFFGNLLR